jgi:hypothetical protein
MVAAGALLLRHRQLAALRRASPHTRHATASTAHSVRRLLRRRASSGPTTTTAAARAACWCQRDGLLGVTTVDTGFELAPTAAYVVGHRHLAVVAGGSDAAGPRVLDAVEAGGRQASDVRWIVLPSLSQWWSVPALLAAFPNATVLAHPRACRHLAAPQKLIEAELAAYGSAGFAALHGRTADAFLSAGVPREQLRAVAADTELPWPVPDADGAEGQPTEASWRASFIHGGGHSTDGELCFVLVRVRPAISSPSLARSVARTRVHTLCTELVRCGCSRTGPRSRWRAVRLCRQLLGHQLPCPQLSERPSLCAAFVSRLRFR